jgi:hypothetical protein
MNCIEPIQPTHRLRHSSIAIANKSYSHIEAGEISDVIDSTRGGEDASYGAGRCPNSAPLEITIRVLLVRGVRNDLLEDSLGSPAEPLRKRLM